MSSFTVKNNVESLVVDNPLAQAAVTLNVTGGDGASFPSTFPFLITIWDESAHPDPSDDAGMEICRCTGSSVDALTIVRAQEGTADVAHAQGERVAMLITAGVFNDATYGVSAKLDGIAAGAIADIVEDTSPQLGGTLDSNSKQIRWSKGSDVASANGLTLGDDGNYFDITGTTSITSIVTKEIGTVVILHFDGILTLTHNATDLVLPGGANITTAAGDEAMFVEYASGDWRCISYTKASGGAIVTGDYKPGGTDVAVTDGGTGESTAAAGFTALKQAATSSATGVVELAIASEINTGTDATRSNTPDALAGSIFGTKNVVVKVIADDNDLSTGDGKAHFTVPIELNGMDLVSVGAHVYTVSSSGTPTFQIHNLTDTVDMLSTVITIDASEKDSKDAATPAVIDTANDDVSTGDEIRFDCDVAGTGTKGMEIRLGFRLP